MVFKPSANAWLSFNFTKRGRHNVSISLQPHQSVVYCEQFTYPVIHRLIFLESPPVVYHKPVYIQPVIRPPKPNFNHKRNHKRNYKIWYNKYNQRRYNQRIYRGGRR